MGKIPRILTNTRVSEVNGLLQQIIDEYKKGDYTADTYLTPAFEKLMEENNRLKVAIMRDGIESDLYELDEVTDTIVTYLHGLVQGYTCHPDASIADAAVILFKMIDKYGLEVKNKSYREEYPLLASMISESKTENYKACIAQLSGCDVRFNQLEIAVDNFNAKQNDFFSMKDDRMDQDNASVIKKSAIEMLNDDVAPYLYAMQKVNADVYGDLAQFVINRINESNAVVRKRKSKVEA